MDEYFSRIGAALLRLCTLGDPEEMIKVEDKELRTSLREARRNGFAIEQDDGSFCLSREGSALVDELAQVLKRHLSGAA